MLQLKNIFAEIKLDSSDELFEDLIRTPDVRIEKIVSTGQCSPEGFWYDQPENEWVILLSGGAELMFAEPEEIVTMKPGDYIFIPAHRKHRVERTDTPTVWLAVFFC